MNRTKLFRSLETWLVWGPVRASQRSSTQGAKSRPVGTHVYPGEYQHRLRLVPLEWSSVLADGPEDWRSKSNTYVVCRCLTDYSSVRRRSSRSMHLRISHFEGTLHYPTRRLELIDDRMQWHSSVLLEKHAWIDTVARRHSVKPVLSTRALSLQIPAG